MKNILKTFIVLSFLTLGFGSCSDSFLDRSPQGAYTDADFYTSEAALKAATAPLYNRAWFDYNKRPALAIGSSRANDSYSPWMHPSFTLFTTTALDADLGDSWQSFYSVVTMANEIIYAVQTKTKNVSDKAKNEAIAESRLMRGTAYFYMLRIWGPVILFEDNQAVIKNPVQPRHKEEDVFKFIINDLKYAAQYLPEINEKGRATSWSAKGLLAKVYLARSGWKKGGTRDAADLQLATETAADVCNNSGLKLYEYEDLFKYKHNNNEESLLAMQWVPLGDWFVCNTLLADLAFSSALTGGVNVWSSLRATVDILKLYDKSDTKRLNATYITQGVKYSYIDIKEGGYTYTGTEAPIKKGVVGGPDDDNDGKVASMSSPLNTYILRLADVYLTYAEAALGNNASLSSGEGLEYFNKVRDRANIIRLSSITLDDIIKERRIEFAMEYCTWYDMVSWYCYKPEKMLAYFNNQERGYRSSLITRDANGEFMFDEMEAPTVPVVVTNNNIFMPYPETDVIQNPLLNAEPQSYNFNE